MPRALDLFSGAGGSARGYHLAGFEVVGVDIVGQPHYPFTFIEADAMTFPLEGFDVVHASPPCQKYSVTRNCRPGKGDEHYVDLVGPTRERLLEWGGPYVIENVVGAPLIEPTRLCGSMFGLDVQRHRLFESNVGLYAPGPCEHDIWEPRFKRGHKGRPNLRKTVAVGDWRHPLELQQAAIGITWMSVAEMSQAVPPAYTEWVGYLLMKHFALSGSRDG